jgi:hypothetical protein
MVTFSVNRNWKIKFNKRIPYTDRQIDRNCVATEQHILQYKNDIMNEVRREEDGLLFR